jgi:hypothetical protein
MRSLQDLDAKLSELTGAFASVATDARFQFICTLANEPMIEQQAYEGIYLIETKPSGPYRDFSSWISAFRMEWEHPTFKKSFTPNMKNKRIAFHSTLMEWMPLYIGKSKNVASRVWEHINLALPDRTFALKLRARPSVRLCDYRLSTINLRALGIRNYDLIAPALESAMREKLHPLVGRQ